MVGGGCWGWGWCKTGASQSFQLSSICWKFTLSKGLCWALRGSLKGGMDWAPKLNEYKCNIGVQLQPCSPPASAPASSHLARFSHAGHLHFLEEAKVLPLYSAVPLQCLCLECPLTSALFVWLTFALVLGLGVQVASSEMCCLLFSIITPANSLPHTFHSV